MPKGVYERSPAQREALRERNRSAGMRAIPRVISEAGIQRLRVAKTTHGQSRSRRDGRRATLTYNIWAAMIQRCTNPQNKDYRLYGARGITVCERWREFPNFLEDMGEKPVGLSLDRIDNDGNYEPGNCRWATASQQRANQRPRSPRSEAMNA